MSDLDTHLADLAPHRAIARVVRAAAAQRDLEADRRADYVSLAPAERMIACYVHANRLSIAMDPADAEEAVGRLPGTWPEKRNPTTTYVIVPATVVADRDQDVLDLILLSVDRRAVGQSRAKGRRQSVKAVERERELCPNCWTDITPAETCMCPESL